MPVFLPAFFGGFMKEYVKNMRPDTCVLYFFSTLVFSVLLTHPVCIMISLAMSLIIGLSIFGKRRVINTAKFGVIMAFFSFVITVLLNHRGMTIITYLPWGNPLTAEAIIYGFFVSILMVSVLLWSSVFSEIATTDKILYVFGEGTPGLAVLLCVTLRFIPTFIEKFSESMRYEKMIMSNKKSLFEQIISVTSSVISCGLDDGANTAVSMKSRGYGKGKRSRYYRRDVRKSDSRIHMTIVVSIVLVLLLIFTGAFKWNYFVPVNTFSSYHVILFFAVLSFYALPYAFMFAEVKSWKK